mmetsp:Transcript_81897/g.265314  ORF Transcript_81897/g.265314 Transcript_81897/m.265314 type:complete len:235 (-) Transcript_81897:177-881(-)
MGTEGGVLPMPVRQVRADDKSILQLVVLDHGTQDLPKLAHLVLELAALGLPGSGQREHQQPGALQPAARRHVAHRQDLAPAQRHREVVGPRAEDGGLAVGPGSVELDGQPPGQVRPPPGLKCDLVTGTHGAVSERSIDVAAHKRRPLELGVAIHRDLTIGRYAMRRREHDDVRPEARHELACGEGALPERLGTLECGICGAATEQRGVEGEVAMWQDGRTEQLACGLGDLTAER